MVNSKFYSTNTASQKKQSNTSRIAAASLTHGGGTEADVKAKISKASVAFLQLMNILKSKVLSLKKQDQDFQYKCRLCSSLETGMTTVTIAKRIKTFVNSCLSWWIRIQLESIPIAWNGFQPILERVSWCEIWYFLKMLSFLYKKNPTFLVNKSL